MTGNDFGKSDGLWVGLTSHLFQTALDNELAGTGIALRQVQAPACLALSGELSQNELAMQLRIEPSTLARILDRMERYGWTVGLAREDVICVPERSWSG